MNKMSVEIPSDPEDYPQKQKLTENEDPPPSYSTDRQDIRHLPTSSLPTASTVPLTVFLIQEPDQYYPVPSRPSQEVSAHVKVSRRQPRVQRTTGVNSRPYNYLEFSILNTLFCCTPIGLLALFYSIQVNIKYSAGRIPEAISASQLAKKLNIAAVLTGTIIWILCGIYPIFRGAYHHANQ